MVRKSEMPETSAFTKQIARGIRQVIAQANINDAQLTKVLNRSKAYISERVNGLKGWNTDELDALAIYFQFSDTFTFIEQLRLLTESKH